VTTPAVIACRRTIARHSRSFALASRLLSPGRRDEAAVIYSWCRRADDAVDLAPASGRAAALVRLRRELEQVSRGEPTGDLVLDAFADVLRIRRIPRAYPEELLAGMEMDVEGHRYRTMEDLLRYAFRVAGTVGLMMCHVMGVRDEAALSNAAHMGIAMQLTNICRDVEEDWDRGRLYVPDALLEDCGAPRLRDRLGGPFPRDAVAPMARAVGRLLDDADRYYTSGDRGLQALPARSALAVKAARLIYAAIGDRVRAAGCDVSAGRQVVPTRDKLVLVARAVTDVAARAARPPLWPRPARVPGRTLEFPRDVLPVA
jgi:phytoene synthase